MSGKSNAEMEDFWASLSPKIKVMKYMYDVIAGVLVSNKTVPVCM